MSGTESSPTSGTLLGGGEDMSVDAAGVRLHAVSRGMGPLVVLLHGFPDFWYGWRHQLPALAEAGFRAVALDLRGYNLSERPRRVADYALDRLVDDVAGAIRASGGRAHAVIGHDWGGVIAWRLSTRHPALFERLAILNAPHPARFREVLRSTSQLLRSWYVGAVQLPTLPEWALRRRGCALLLRFLRAEHRRAGAFDDTDARAYASVFGPPGALRAALAYYRALLRAPRSAGRAMTDAVTHHPTLLLWGERDSALVSANATGLDRWVPNGEVVRVPGAGHFVQSDAPEIVNAALVRFLEAQR
jgi:pimeloyl-ACP methyl ester carboxylesterase